MTLFVFDIENDWEVNTFSDFISKFKHVNMKELVLAVYKDIDDICDVYDSEHFTSDGEAIAQFLDELPKQYHMRFIENRHDGYWIIEEVNIK